MGKKTLEERFWAKVDKNGPNGCWVWTARATANGGYGRINLNGVSYRAHRMSWELVNGSIPVGLFVCHKCDNPPCVNPEHLFLGTSLDNIRDCIKKGRHNTKVKPRLTKKEVIEIKRLRLLGHSRKEVAHKFNTTVDYISTIINERAWKHIKIKRTPVIAKIERTPVKVILKRTPVKELI